MSRSIRNQAGAAMVETTIALLALAPFMVGIPLLGKQLDIKHKTFDAARYSVWERTIWRSDGASNRKSEADILLETRDRILGDPRSGLLAAPSLSSLGVSENTLWRDHRGERLIDYADSSIPVSLTHSRQPALADVGYFLAPALAYGEGVLRNIATALQVDDLDLNRNSLAATSISIGLRATQAQLADQSRTLGLRSTSSQAHERLVHSASAAVLSDTWSSNDENDFRRRVDDLTTDELVEALESPGRVIGLQALGRGQPLYGEGRFGWDPDLRVRSSALPAAYIARQ